MFEPINGPSNHYQGPATGLGTEAGDTWHAAVSKINAGFKRLVAAIEGVPEKIDADARKGIAALEDAVAALQKRADDAEQRAAESEAKLKALVTTAQAAQAPPTGDAPEVEANKPKG